MNKTKMDFSSHSLCKPSVGWFEISCNIWLQHYNWVLSEIKFLSDSDVAWFEDQLNSNKLYDV